jgi:hypothetical protein
MRFFPSRASVVLEIPPAEKPRMEALLEELHANAAAQESIDTRMREFRAKSFVLMNGFLTLRGDGISVRAKLEAEWRAMLAELARLDAKRSAFLKEYASLKV